MSSDSGSLPRHSDPLPDFPSMRFHGYRGIWVRAERHSEALAEVERLREALWECVKLSGADVSDGPPRPGTRDWPQLPELAVREVARLREDHDCGGAI